MPSVNTLFGGPVQGAPTMLGPGSADSTTMAGHPLIRGARADASEMALSRTAGIIVAAAVGVIALVHVGGFRSTITIGG